MSAHAPFPPGKFGVIYVDPPWLYQMYSNKGHAKGAGAQYDGMTYDQLAAMRDDILFAAAPNCVLFMWTTWAATDGVDFLQQAQDLMRVWGFKRKTGGSWHKTTRHGKNAMGTGYIYRTTNEPFILGTIGKPTIKNRSTINTLLTGDLPEDLNELGITITAERREHSRKPDEMAARLVNHFDGPYLEMFARTRRPGWEAYGNETEKF